MIIGRSLILALVLVGCGGAPARPLRAEPDANGAYDLAAERHIPVGASWDEHAVHAVEETQVTHVLDNAETTASRQRVELVGRVTMLEGERASILVTTLTVDDGSGPRPLVAPGETVIVTHGDDGSIVGPRGPFSEVDDALVREVIHVGSSSGHDRAAATFGPPGGLSRIGETWSLDPDALAALFRGPSNDVTVRGQDVEGVGRLSAGAAWEGRESLAIELDLAVHDLGIPVPEGATIDDIEVRMVGGASWPLDLTVPSGGDAMRVETAIQMHVLSPELPGVAIQIDVVRLEASAVERSGYRAP